MAKDMTPMMRQYYDIKNQNQDKVLFFRLGDFYEMFDSDAIEISKLLNLTLTHRGSTPMCGIPYHASKNYLKRLLDMDKKIAICEQVSLSNSPKEIAKREIVQIYTPGTVIEDDYLDSLQDSFVLALHIIKNELIASYADITSSKFYAKKLNKANNLNNLTSFLSQINIKEILICDDIYFTNKDIRKILDDTKIIITKLPSFDFSIKEGFKILTKHFNTMNLKCFNFEDNDISLATSGALLKYLSLMCNTKLSQFKDIKLIDNSDYIELSEETIKNLEIAKNLYDGKTSYTLYSALNYTKTSLGSRLLKEVLLFPLASLDKIIERQKWVEYFHSNFDEKNRVRKILESTSDLVRLSSKLEMKKSNPRDLISIKESLFSFFSLVETNEKYLNIFKIDKIDKLLDLADLINKAINIECTNVNNEGTIINIGFDKILDELRNYESNSSTLLNSYLDHVREKTGITTLKIGQNKIIGLFIEVSKGQINRVPDTFIRRQTLVNCERFTNDELSEAEEKINTAKENANNREKEIYNKITACALALSDELNNIGTLFSYLDLYQSFAHVAYLYNYVKPVFNSENIFILKDSRHPVVEQYLDKNSFVSNDFDSTSSNFKLITGPNMAGKSTYLRQVALITLLAHTGSFVPAKIANLPLIDKVFSRVGASDNLTKGESTFMVEMIESSYILRNATKNSLVIMDEIGRGTSTQDGMALAYSIMQYLSSLNCYTLFATHYHELTMLDTDKMDLLTLDVFQDKDDIKFLKKVVTGVAKSSYGLHVAKLAGIKSSIIKQAAKFQNKHFSSYSIINDNDQLDLFTDTSLLSENENTKILDQILDFDISSSTPIDAFLLIKSLQDELKKNR